jgi:hypothetical protein
MPVNSSEKSKLDLSNIHHMSNDNYILSVDTIDTSKFSTITTNTSNFTIAANSDFTTNLGHYLNQSICLFDNLCFEKKESNILIINYNKVFIWDKNVSSFKIVDIKNFDYNLIETDEKHDSISNNAYFNSDFKNSAETFLTLLLEQNDLIFIDTEKNKNYKFCSKIKKWILLDNKSFFNVEFDNNITIFNIKRNNSIKELLIEKNKKIKYHKEWEGLVFAPYITTTNNNIITLDCNYYNNINLNNSIYNRYTLGVDTANNNYLTTSLGHP